ncbi:hypothetical protein BCR44DRAFT_1297180 [Catenaria anguillulae PL171]|uniref:Uncharacterized protein n=1 Tax=Catenaria anguillulae PL171 TaxID=765915 RepID=A0A1Y2H7N0_9FUNG|nr:hypothetical protein BCR44DRAFT_1297180 [Catenaria anguillulae PL171]
MELPPGSTQPGSNGSTIARNGMFGTGNRRMSILLSGRSGNAANVTSSNGPRVPTQFERLVENFISKHVRDYVDEHMRRTTDAAIAAATASSTSRGLASGHITTIPKSPTLGKVSELSSFLVSEQPSHPPPPASASGKTQSPMDALADSGTTAVNPTPSSPYSTRTRQRSSSSGQHQHRLFRLLHLLLTPSIKPTRGNTPWVVRRSMGH